MSQENVETVRSICAAWGRGEFGSAEWAHPEIDYVIAGGPAPGHWTGLAGMAEGWRSWLDAFEGFRGEPEEIREVNGERVLALVLFSGLGRTSGLDLEETQSRGANLFHFRGGKVTSLVTYVNRDEALEAVGLSEQDAHADS
jgi:ketosteroid isomerase-like protein